jgi:hypothetical protein
MHEVLSPKRCASYQRVGRAETRVDGRRATQKQEPPDGEFHRANASLTPVTPTYGKPKPLLNGAAQIGARIVWRAQQHQALQSAQIPDHPELRKQTAIPWTNERLS